MEKQVPCNFCGSTDVKTVIKPVNNQAKVSDIFSAAGGVRGTQNIVKCQICCLTFVSPRFAQKDVVKAYSQGSDHGYATQTRGRLFTFEKAIKLLNQKTGKVGKILDVGCANGGFLIAAKKYGWNVTGIEPSSELVNLARKQGLKVLQGTLPKAKFKKASFDVVTYWDVLEHVSDPAGEIEEVYRILKPGGLLLVNYPDYGSMLSKITGKYWWFLLSVHLYYFDQKSLEKLLIKTGFVPYYHKRHFQYLELGYLAQMFSIYNRAISKIAAWILKLIGLSKLLIPYYASQKTILARRNMFL